MNLSAPTMVMFVISLVIGILAIVGTLTAIPYVSANAFWVMTVAWIVLVLGSLFRGA